METTDPYADRLVKSYQHWNISVHGDQRFLGRCVLWCKREDALDLADATPEEQAELFQILNELRSGLTTAFGAEWFNYGFLGNITRHLHGHLLPRYSKPVEFEGVTFVDPDFNKNPWKASTETDEDSDIPKELLYKIRDRLKWILP